MPSVGALQRRISDAEFLRIPKVNSRLVARLDLRIEVRTRRCNAANDRVFGFERRIGIEKEDIVVLDAVIGWPAGEDIPDGLKERAGNEPRVREAKRGQARKENLIQRISQHRLDEAWLIHGRVRRCVRACDGATFTPSRRR